MGQFIAGRLWKFLAPYESPRHNRLMLYTLALILIIAWLLGLVSTYTMCGFIHILLVVAVIMILVSLIQGRRTG